MQLFSETIPDITAALGTVLGHVPCSWGGGSPGDSVTALTLVTEAPSS